ncbi:TraB/GumN family protein [Megalodesulfovibrio gigas]|nr:TraB/GumN family protein [Megalodesulfovibrio gigas]
MRLARAFIARILPLLCLLLVLVAPAAAQPAATFMWEIRKGEAILHLLGSLHMADATLYPVDPAVNRAFLDAKALAVEVDVSPDKLARVAPQMDAFTRLPDGQTLADVLSPEGAARVTAFLHAQDLPSRLMVLKPLGLMAVLTNQRMDALGYSTNYGVDEHFLRRARAAGMPIHELETLEFQLTMDQDLSPAVQEAVLMQALEEMDDVAIYTRATLDAWKRGDAAELARLTFEDRHTQPMLEPFYEILFDRRNEAMANGIARFLDRGEKVFVVVGAGHLVGERSILHFLQQRGLQCTQVPAMAPGNSSPARTAFLHLAP